MDQDEYLDTQECAMLIKRTPGAVRNLVMRRKIPHRKPAGRLVFLLSEIEQWIGDSLIKNEIQKGMQEISRRIDEATISD